MKLVAFLASYISAQNSLSWQMLKVLLALVPAILSAVFLLGIGVLIHLVLAIATAISAEAVILFLRHRPVKAALLDLSGTVTAVLLALSLPVLAP